MEISTSPEAREKLNAYPKEEQEKICALRELIFDVGESSKIPEIEETLKWGELSYLTKKGSTIRIDTRNDKKKGSTQCISSAQASLSQHLEKCSPNPSYMRAIERSFLT